ncbi:MAG: beta-N-acetylhexosaminidase [Gammaproteobacteria bacterium]|nr:beta-N-acetylhexosaminidase [Gammaproteobacteria bacterium]
MSLGPVMLGLESLELSAEEKNLLMHPLVGGVILFSRNYHSPEQVARLVSDIHACRQPRLLIAVDHEGGRVQRFREGFTRLPAVRRLGEIYDADSRRAMQLARLTGWLMATELRAVGVDFSFAPVLDLDRGVSGVIGDRAFHSQPDVVAELAQAYIGGMQKAGMEAVGKHFPGHGGVAADSHHALPIDPRPFAELQENDMASFAQVIRSGKLAGIMPAHVVYTQVDAQPAGFSKQWLQNVLRIDLGFQGAIFSDDLDMAGAGFAGGPPQRAQAALDAGCDMVLACNDRQAAVRILDGLRFDPDPLAHRRLTRFHGRGRITTLADLRQDGAWQTGVRWVSDFDAFPPLDRDLDI